VDATLEIGNITGLPGSIELQGDHATVSFRNIVLTPLTKKGK
jgi:hypothetical protein